jgi:predicted transcriptional regulator
MKVSEIVKILDASMLNACNRDMEIRSACGSDLMSDVMAYAKGNVLLLTGLVNPQVVRTAEMMDIKAIVFVRGKNPGKVIIDLANEKGIVVMATTNSMFIACGKLFEAGLTGRGV